MTTRKPCCRKETAFIRPGPLGEKIVLVRGLYWVDLVDLLYSSVYFLNKGAFRAFFQAKLRITSSKLIVLAIADTMLSLAKSTRGPWPLLIIINYIK